MYKCSGRMTSEVDIERSVLCELSKLMFAVSLEVWWSSVRELVGRGRREGRIKVAFGKSDGGSLGDLELICSGNNASEENR